MRLTMIGHATLFCETEDCRILMDPVLWDPHQEGLLDVYPQREVALERLPEPDLVVLSHRHLDHFDLRSLAHLPRTADVLIPEDDFLERCFRRLGYPRVHRLPEFGRIETGRTRLLATRSEIPVPELGFVIADGSGTLWNAVDSAISHETIRRVREEEPRVDVLLAGWQPMLEVHFQWHRSIAFPLERYRAMVDVAATVRPRAVVPGANGFRYTGASTWLNRIVFPITRERYLSDLGRMLPASTALLPLDPGDVLELDGERIEILPAASGFVRTTGREPGALDFCPVEVDSAMVDENPDGHPAAVLVATVEAEVCGALPAFLNAERARIARHAEWQAVYQLEVVFPGGERRRWWFDLAAEPVVAHPGRHPEADLFTLITASGLHGLVTRTRGWDYVNVGGFCRRFQKVYRTAPGEPIGQEAPVLKDPLRLRFPTQELFEAVMERELERWLATAPAVSEAGAAPPRELRRIAPRVQQETGA